MEKCLTNALANHCSRKAAEFFMDAFSKRDDPLIALSCKIGTFIFILFLEKTQK
jgi:hypothetical protein